MKVAIVIYFAVSCFLVAVMLKLEVECYLARKECQDEDASH